MVQLHREKKRFARQNTQVLLLGFDSPRRVQGWLQRTGVTFPFLLDPEREVYRAYGLERSILRSWSLRNLWSYVRAVFRGGSLPRIGADPNQLGGDFLVSREGEVVWAYYGQDPVDRPTVKEILERIRALNDERSGPEC